MRIRWLRLPLVLGLALGAWIAAIDTTGDPATAWLLCGATLGAATLLARS
jgi:hypothetical protein